VELPLVPENWANVLIVPPGVTFRMLVAVAMKSVPAESTATSNATRNAVRCGRTAVTCRIYDAVAPQQS